ncbi:MAG TPA: sel1 repeat family protein [Metalysinibacillus jejuensis]|uniref:Sel1 repeat family protein n=1 Tax=Metalysinibacillus jejuensis TaxID=914327 RepID=A0A921NBI4_9BACL|nr:tetratricopeptide repeat protein [Metalysinibacillus jejuensis]HJH10989.1 sel1 repeat family protein [Metalysinibacillus jejuensis]
MEQAEELYLQGNAAYEDGQLVHAFRSYEAASALGHPDATNNLADMYLHGEYVGKNTKRAFQLFLVAAKAGVHEAMFTLGLLCENGIGVVVAPEQAYFWYHRSAKYQDSLAQYRLGSIYYEGLLNKKRNVAKALYWYGLAAQQGHLDAQYNLGYIYNNEQDEYVDYAKGRFWYKEAARQGDVLACRRLEEIYEIGLGTKVDKQKAHYWGEQAAQFECMRGENNE